MQKIRQVMATPLLQQIIKFTVVGGTIFVIDSFLLIFMTEKLGWNYLVSATCSFTIAVLINYILSVCWVFKFSTKPRGWRRLWQMILFIWLSVCGLGINNFLIWFTVEIFGYHYMIGKVIATAVIMVFNFTTRKMLLERKSRKVDLY